jgi:hypothetical protein
MNRLHKIFISLMLLVAVIVIVSSCKEDEPDELRLSRLFKPTGFDIETGETSAAISWNPSLFTQPGEVEYLVELSKDPDNFANPELSRTSAESELTVTDTEIDIKTDYYARVKALGINGADDSNWLVSDAFQITGQIFILPVNEYDVTTTAVKIKWKVEDVLTKIVITPQGGAAAESSISASEASAGEKVVEGLTPNTTHTVEIFKGDISKGSATFTTKNAFTGSNIVDLRGITGKRKILADTLGDIPAGSVVLLKRGEIYEITSTDASRNLNKSVTIVSGADFNSQLARIYLTSNFNIIANSVIDSIVFRDVIVKGNRAAGASFDNDYIFNINVVGTIKKFKFDNCKIHRLRGTVRVQTASTGAKIENYTINNCLVDSIRDFSVLHASAASSFLNATITNSTFTRCRKFVTHAAPGNNSLVIRNCTFNEVPTGALTAPANFFIDFGVAGAPVVLHTSATGVTLSNCIIGKSWVETAGSTIVGGIRINASASVTVANTFTLSDFVSDPAYQLPGVVAYPGSSTSVFTNPALGDFHIKDTAFPGALTAGDPRWR